MSSGTTLKWRLKLMLKVVILKHIREGAWKLLSKIWSVCFEYGLINAGAPWPVLTVVFSRVLFLVYFFPNICCLSSRVGELSLFSYLLALNWALRNKAVWRHSICCVRVMTPVLLCGRVAFFICEDRVVFWLVTEEIAWQDGRWVCQLLHWSDARPTAPGSVHRGGHQFTTWDIRRARILKVHGDSTCKIGSP